MKRWYCPKCEEYPEEIFQVYNEHVESFFWEETWGAYTYNDLVEYGEVVRVECEHGHQLDEREVDEATSLAHVEAA